MGFVTVSMRRAGAVALGGRLQRAVSVAGLGQRMSCHYTCLILRSGWSTHAYHLR
jgi:hypothetical protein